ncbi:MAG: hypothetical protein LUG47_01805 [Clostridiales bacterium]|nr:hypothetical protein [Clostridiales bacterium]
MRETEKQRRLSPPVIILLIVLAVLAAVGWYRYSEYRGVSPLSLDVEQVTEFRSEMREADPDLSQIDVTYWFPQNLAVTCYRDSWTEEQAEDFLSELQELVTDEAFQTAYTAAHDSRYGTEQGSPEVVMVYFYEEDGILPAYRYSATFPEVAWVLIG